MSGKGLCVCVHTCIPVCPGQNGNILMDHGFGMSGVWCLCPHIPHLSQYLESSGSWVSGVGPLCVLGGDTHVCLEWG